MTTKIYKSVTRYWDPQQEGTARRSVYHEALRTALDDGADLSKPFIMQFSDMQSPSFDADELHTAEARLVSEVYPKWQCRSLYRFPAMSAERLFLVGKFYPEADVSSAIEERCRQLREHEGSCEFDIHDSVVHIPRRQIGHFA